MTMKIKLKMKIHLTKDIQVLCLLRHQMLMRWKSLLYFIRNRKTRNRRRSYIKNWDVTWYQKNSTPNTDKTLLSISFASYKIICSAVEIHSERCVWCYWHTLKERSYSPEADQSTIRQLSSLNWVLWRVTIFTGPWSWEEASYPREPRNLGNKAWTQQLTTPLISIKEAKRNSVI